MNNRRYQPPARLIAPLPQQEMHYFRLLNVMAFGKCGSELHVAKPRTVFDLLGAHLNDFNAYTTTFIGISFYTG